MPQKLKHLFILNFILKYYMLTANKKCPIHESGCLSITIYNFTFSPHLHVYFDRWRHISSDAHICIIDSFFVRGSRGRHHKDFHWGGLDGTGEVERLRQKQDPGREGRMGLRQGTSGYVTSQQTTISTSVWSYYYYQHIYSYNLSY